MTLSSLARCVASPALLLATGAAAAHPGHDTAPPMSLLDTWVHLLTQPDHLGLLAVVALLTIAAGRSWRSGRASRRRRV